MSNESLTTWGKVQYGENLEHVCKYTIPYPYFSGEVVCKWLHARRHGVYVPIIPQRAGGDARESETRRAKYSVPIANWDI